jgi:hypothetical protein
MLPAAQGRAQAIGSVIIGQTPVALVCLVNATSQAACRLVVVPPLTAAAYAVGNIAATATVPLRLVATAIGSSHATCRIFVGKVPIVEYPTRLRLEPSAASLTIGDEMAMLMLMDGMMLELETGQSQIRLQTEELALAH